MVQVGLRRKDYIDTMRASIVVVIIGVLRYPPMTLSFNVETNEVEYIFSPLLKMLKSNALNDSNRGEWLNISSTFKPSYFGYDFTLQVTDDGTIRMLTGSPKLINSANLTDQYSNETLPQDPRGNIQACEIGNTSFFQNGGCSPAHPPNPQPGDNLGLSLSIRPDGEGFTCSPTRALNCGVVRSNPGFCFKSNDFGKTWNATKHTKNIACPARSKVDVLFLLDGSASIGEDNFKTVKSWVKDISKEIGIDEGTVDVGVVQYSMHYRKFIETHIEIGSSDSYKEFADEVDNITLHGWETWTGAALKSVLDDFQNTKNYGKNKTKQVLVLLTDGHATDGETVAQHAENLRNIGVIPFAVGVGNINKTELRLIANGDPESDARVYTVGNFTGLQAIANEMKTKITELVLEGQGLQNTTSYEMEFAEMGLAAAYGSYAPSRTKRATQSEPEKNGRLYLGAVGAYDWSGTVTKYDNVDDTTPDIPSYDEVQKVLPNRTKESYMGYSVTTGYFEDTRTEYVATGAPRYMLMGAVIVYEPRNANDKFNNHRRLMGHPSKRKLGSYFGGSVLAVDVNNDGKDELFVGAPLYVHETYDEGRVFVYVTKRGAGTLNSWERDSYEPLELVGDNLPGGRFGTAMASAGDLNKDGYNDVIVGAPLVDGDRGAVFVYHGNADGVDIDFKQKILASEMKGVTLKYFGQSLQGGVDLDGNKYPDIAVGAPKSDTVVIFRSRPVVNIGSEIDFTTGDINIFDCIEQNYVNCTEIRVCFTASGTSVEDVVGIKFNVTIDSKNVGPDKRFEFREQNDAGSNPKPTWSMEIDLTKDIPSCYSKKLNMKSNIKNYMDPIVAEVEYDLLASHTSKPLSSVRDPSISNKKNDSLNFVKRCAGDVCRHDLRIDADMTLPNYQTAKGVDLTNGGKILIIDQLTASSPVSIKVNLSNHGETAFDTQVDITYTSRVTLSNLVMKDSLPKTNLSCIVESSDANDAGGGNLRETFSYNYKTNIMGSNTWCFFELNLITDNLKNSGSMETFMVKIEARTSDSGGSSSETNPSDNIWTKSPKVLYRSDFLLKKAGETTMSFNYTIDEYNATSVKQIGENTDDITAELSVSGNGYSKIPELNAVLKYPQKTASGDMLLYLYKVECTSKDSSASCMCNLSNVNSYNLTIEDANENNTNGSYVTITPPEFPIEASTYDCYSATSENVTCDTLKCSISDLGDSGQITIKAYFRLWSSSITFNGTNYDGIELRSGFRVDSNDSLYIIDKDGKKGIVHSEEIVVNAKLYTEPDSIESDDNTWIYILAALGGLLLLIILVVILWKVGFFKSKYADMKKDAEDDLADETEFPANGTESQAEMVD